MRYSISPKGTIPSIGKGNQEKLPGRCLVRLDFNLDVGSDEARGSKSEEVQVTRAFAGVGA